MMNELLQYTISEFCASVRISRSHFYDYNVKAKVRGLHTSVIGALLVLVKRESGSR